MADECMKFETEFETADADIVYNAHITFKRHIERHYQNVTVTTTALWVLYHRTMTTEVRGVDLLKLEKDIVAIAVKLLPTPKEGDKRG